MQTVIQIFNFREKANWNKRTFLFSSQHFGNFTLFPDPAFKADFNAWSRCESKLGNAKLKVLRGMEEDGSFAAVKHIQCGNRRNAPLRFENEFSTTNKIILEGGGHNLGNDYEFVIKVCGWANRT